ncbi:serine hydrolase domain-containing protein [Actinosynnema sp. CA-248983]
MTPDDLHDLAARHGVPGAQVGILDPDGIRVLTTGVTSRATAVPVDENTLFQYGSITKVWTTTLVVQLVDEGLLTLDTPVVDVLPTFRIADPDHTSAITVRHLLTHTSGIDGDVFTDTGHNDDCVERYVDALAGVGSTTRPGGPLSYCNAGFVVAGRIVEVLRGKPWDDALKDHLVDPLGLDHVITRVHDAPLFRTAVGHENGEPVKRWMLPRSVGPAGLITGTARDLLRFTAAHLDNSVSRSAQAMREEQVSLREVSTVDSGWGLGWVLQDWAGVACVAHGGRTIGQAAKLWAFPERGLALCVLTNAASGSGMAEEVATIFGKEHGLVPPEPRVDDNADLAGLEGVYEILTARLTLSRDEHGFHLDVVGDGVSEPRKPVTPTGRGRFVAELNGARREFAHLEHDGADFLYLNRLFRRVTDH